MSTWKKVKIVGGDRLAILCIALEMCQKVENTSEAPNALCYRRDTIHNRHPA